MTFIEARSRAKDILLSIADLVDSLDSADRRVLMQLADLLDEVYASHAGISSIDKPLGVPWSVMNIRLFELLRRDYLPNIVSTTPLSDTQLKERFGKSESSTISEPTIFNSTSS